ncbi:sporulation related protein [Gelidibacter sediminis]|uniref:Sporulation related protein n=1 Tax=Gelidibacter sediminis TaxID=1608710 RepID=A0A4R7Q9M6_9FLAO|nr:SPOR domain-containing protein [Gelidibacter sediminis]TDU43581.1 sporulation related protein [Gelidibacter sediminis]
MHIETYISDLLYRYDCVTIPEFGAFLTKRISAKMDESSHTFYPPKKVISFNEQLKHNDGLLASYIADAEDIPYEVAVQKISKQVKSINAFLIEGETLNFSNIGDLILNADGKIIFEPSNNSNYLTDAFGLTEFKVSNVNREVYKERVEALQDTLPIDITPERRAKRNYLKYAAVALIALTMGGFAASTFYNNQVETHNQLAQEAANEQLDAKVQEATFVIENPLPAATLKVEKQQGRYHIIAGAFRVAENSDKKVEQLRAQGFKARTIGVNKYGLHEVVYSSYKDSNEALMALRNIRQNFNKEAWLLVRDLN